MMTPERWESRLVIAEDRQMVALNEIEPEDSVVRCKSFIEQSLYAKKE